jgi:histidinol-phosphate aminotransferase
VPGERDSLTTRRDLPGLVVIRSLTKTWGLAGLRVGYVLAAAAAVKELARMQPPWPVSTLALAALEACSSPRATAEAQAWARDMGVERDRLAAALDRLPGVRVVPGAHASFLLLHAVPPAAVCHAADHAASHAVGRGADRGAGRGPGFGGVRERLRAQGYAVRRGDTFPGLGPGWVRVAVRDRGTNEAFTAALAAVMRGDA